jgi:hypothetical protein
MMAWLTRLFGSPAAAPVWVEPAELRRWLAGEGAPVIVDVRGPDEFDARAHRRRAQYSARRATRA